MCQQAGQPNTFRKTIIVRSAFVPICILALMFCAVAQADQQTDGAVDSATVQPAATAQPAESTPPTPVSNEAPTSEDSQPAEAAPHEEQVPQIRLPVVARKPWELSEQPESSGPDVYLLPDEQGKLRKVLGFHYADFLQAWNRRKGLAGLSPPRYVFDSLNISGAATNVHAQLRIEVGLITEVDGWVDVPLQLPTFILQQWKVSDKLDGECLVFDPRRHGHVVWLKGQRGKRRDLVLEGLVRLKVGADKRSLVINPPRATTSHFVLRVPVSDAQCEASTGMDVSTSPSDAGGTEVRLTGQANPLRLHWQPPHQQVQTGAAVIEALGKTTVRIERRRAQYDVKLKINSYGNPLEGLRVRLPRGATLVEDPLPHDYQVVLSKQKVEDESVQVVDVQLKQPRSDSWTLHLAAEQTLVENKEEATCEVGGFEVLDAYRQSGTVALEVEDPLQAYFDLHGDVEQESTAEPATPLQGSTPIANFAYSRFPWKLDVHTLPRQRRVSVRPRYELQINEEEARLNLELDYQFTGAQMFSVRVDMRGWKLTDDPIESGGAVARNRYVETLQGLLVLPLVNPDVQRVRISLVARRNVRLGRLNLPLPEPLEAFVLPGQLTVRADSSLEVSPELGAMEGVSVVSAADDLSQPRAEDQELLELRTFLARAALSVDVSRRARQVAVEVQTAVDVGKQATKIKQQLHYQVKYQPVSQLLLQLPQPLWDNDSLSVQLDGEKIDVRFEPPSQKGKSRKVAPPSKTGKTAWRPMVVSLPRPMLNSFRLDVAFQVAYSKLAPELLTPLILPLVAPQDAVTSNVVAVHAQETVRATLDQLPDEDAWIPNISDEQEKTSPSTLQLRGSGKPTTIPLLAHLESADNEENATLECAWLQTWIAGTTQQDRAVFRFRTSHARVFARMPRRFEARAIEVLLDDRPVEFEVQSGNRIAVVLPNRQQRKRHTLELRYQHPLSLASWGTLHIALARLESRETTAPVYWQLVLPRGWIAGGSPEQLTPEFDLGWKNYQWGRQPSRYQPDLERWSGASIEPAPTASSSQYLFRALTLPSTVDIVIGRQVWLTLASIVAAFGMGLLWMYTSLARRGGFWLTVAVGLLALVISYPEVTLVAVQAILWGGVMTLTAVVLRRVLTGSAPQDVARLPSALSTPSAATEPWAQTEASRLDEEEAPTEALHAGGSVS